MPFKEKIAVKPRIVQNSWIQNAEWMTVKEAGRYIYRSAFDPLKPKLI
jgi:hypothetical protein